MRITPTLNLADNAEKPLHMVPAVLYLLTDFESAGEL